jgi:hypothetical protein
VILQKAACGQFISIRVIGSELGDLRCIRPGAAQQGGGGVDGERGGVVVGMAALVRMREDHPRRRFRDRACQLMRELRQPE